MGSELSITLFCHRSTVALALLVTSAAAIASAHAQTEPAAPAKVAPTPASEIPAEDKETARNLMDIGHAKLAAGDHAAALEAYQGADQIMHVTSTGLGVGKALAKLNRLIEAREKLLEVERIPKLPDEPAVLAEARNEAATLQALIADRIPSLTIAVTGAPKGTPVSIEVDGRAIAAALVKLPRKLDPGTHVVAASAPGYPRVEQSVELAPNEHPTVTLTLEPSAAPEPSAPLPEAAPEPIPDDDAFPSTLTYIGYGAAAVFLVAGGVTGGLSLAKASDAKAQCPTVTTCPETARPDRDASVVLAHVSTVSFALAGAGALLGTYGLLFDEGGLMTEARVGPGYLGIAGQF